MTDFKISEEDFERFAQQMIVTFPLMPEHIRRDWSERIKRVYSNRCSKYDALEILEKWRMYSRLLLMHRDDAYKLETKFIEELIANPDGVIEKGESDGWLP